MPCTKPWPCPDRFDASGGQKVVFSTLWVSRGTPVIGSATVVGDGNHKNAIAIDTKDNVVGKPLDPRLPVNLIKLREPVWILRSPRSTIQPSLP